MSLLEEKSVEPSETNKYKNKIITIPNILSFIRLCLIPLIVWIYVGKNDPLLTGIVVLFSCLTDVVDGFIARRFNMISDVGKVLDPIADKATQGAVIILLALDFPLMFWIIGLMAIKELFMGITGYMIIKKCDIVLAAEWYGKAATVVLSAVMAIHLLWSNIPPIASNIIVISGIAMVLLSIILYAKRNFEYLLGKRG